MLQRKVSDPKRLVPDFCGRNGDWALFIAGLSPHHSQGNLRGGAWGGLAQEAGRG